MEKIIKMKKAEGGWSSAQETGSSLLLDVICDYLQRERLLSDIERQLFRKHWNLRGSEGAGWR